MRRCPECRRDYHDETLLYCLDDGTALLEGPASADEPATAILAAADPPDNIGYEAQVNSVLSADTASRTSSAEYFATALTRRKTGVLVALVALLSTAGVVFAIYKFTQNRPALFQAVEITRLTNIGNAITAQISPNGEYVAHVVYEGGKTSVRIWDVATKSNMEIVPPTEDDLAVSTFSPDSRYIYYRRFTAQPPVLYQIAVLGGASKKIIETANSISFAPDGKRFAFPRTGPMQGENSMIIANADGTAEQTLATRKGGERFGTDGPAWSPDGQVIASGTYIDGTNMTIAAVSVADGTVKPLTPQTWARVNRVAWLRDGSGLVFSADVEQEMSQIWYVSYPEGNVRRITNDANAYGSGSVSMTADSSTIATIEVHTTSNIFVAPAGDAARARQITGVRRNAPASGISWTPGGQIIYPSMASGNNNLWLMGADGTGSRQLTSGPATDVMPVVSPDGRYIVFGSMRSGRYNLWRMDADGSHPKQLTGGGNDTIPSFSPDGRWVIYEAGTTSDLRKVSIDGGESVQLTDRLVRWPSVSPKDGLIVGMYSSDDNSRPIVAVFSPEGGAPLKTFDRPPGSFSFPRWTPDGRSIIYVVTRAETSSLWSQSLDGGPPKQLADFSPEQIFSFDISRDGKSFAFSRGTTIRDVILITDKSKQ